MAKRRGNMDGIKAWLAANAYQASQEATEEAVRRKKAKTGSTVKVLAVADGVKKGKKK